MLKFYSTVAILCAAAMIPITLMSGKAKMTIQHNPVIKVNKNEELRCVDDVCHVYIEEHLYSPGTYLHISKQLNDLEEKPETIYVHLAGEGGDLKGAKYIAAILKATGVRVVAQIEGDIENEHALLALMIGNLQVIPPNALMILRTVKEYNEANRVCREELFKNQEFEKYHRKEMVRQTAEDYKEEFQLFLKETTPTIRGHDAYTRCIEATDREAILNHQMLTELVRPYLPLKVLNRFKDGVEVIVQLRGET